jgi:hypothetical protein
MSHAAATAAAVAESEGGPLAATHSIFIRVLPHQSSRSRRTFVLQGACWEGLAQLLLQQCLG